MVVRVSKRKERKTDFEIMVLPREKKIEFTSDVTATLHEICLISSEICVCQERSDAL